MLWSSYTAMSSPIPSVPSFLATDHHAQHIVEQASDALFVYDLEGRFVDANPAAYQLVGYTRDELLRLSVGDLGPGFDLDRGTKRWREMRLGEAVTLEGTNRRKDRSVFPTEARISVVETHAGRLLIAVVRDASERKRAEGVMFLRAQQQQGIAELGAQALGGKELDALLQDALRLVSQTLNLELCRVLEHVPDRGELVVRAGLNLRADEIGTRAASDDKECTAGYVLHTGEPAVVQNFAQETRFQRTLWLQAENAFCGMSVPIGSAAPRYGVLAGYSREPRDFTADDVYFVQAIANVLAAAIARRGGEDALREVEARYQRIAAITAGMVFQLIMQPDATTTTPFVRVGCRQVYGSAPAELRAEPRLVHWLVLPEDKENYKQILRRTVATNQPFHWEGRVVHRSGAVRWVTARARLDPQPDGSVIWDGVVLDVSELKEAQATMFAAKEEAERAQSQAEYAREEAERSRQEAEQANLAKSQFLSRMSHELRTPLNAILGFSQVLELSLRDEADDQCIQHILKGGRHLLSLIDEVLDLARVEAGELALSLTTTSFGKLMQECTSFISKLAQARGITCTAQLGPACRLAIRADELRLRQVLLNLLSNAIKYDREGGQVTLSCQEMPGGWVRCSVEDTGLGISPEGLTKLFVPFERLGQELTGTEGLGLGLVVSQHLVEAMGGSLGAESRLGIGSTFWVEVPLAIEEAEPAISTEAALSLAQEAPQRAIVTVLYVEDNPSNQQVIKTVVQRLRPQWRFLLVADGIGGLQMARDLQPDIVLLDLELPGMKGDQVLAALRSDARTSLLPVLLLSADATTQTRERLLTLGASDYVTKPFNVAELLQKIEGLLRPLP